MDLSAYFLVRVRYAVGAAPGGLRGQAEHVGSGRRVDFLTAAELVGFLSDATTTQAGPAPKVSSHPVGSKTDDAAAHPITPEALP